MCSRQERIQKDIDVVIQKSRAEKDCLFAGVSYSVHVSEDYPDNTYVSSSENDEDVLVTTDPIPVIFHRIATELRKTNDINCCLSIRSKLQKENGEESRQNSTVEEDSEGDNDSEEFYYGGQVNYDGELHKHPQLEADLSAVRELYGPHAVSLREYGAIDDVDIDLHIDVSFLDEEIAVAWEVIRAEPIIVRLHCSLTQYLNGPVPTVDVFQISTKERFGLGHQLKKIMQTFVSQQWKQSKEKSNCQHGKKLSEKKVKSPSYPPPGCGKSKSKLKPEQDEPPTNGAKCIPIRDRGFLVQTIEFAEQRIPVLNEYCVVCDEPHVFQNGPMLRRAAVANLEASTLSLSMTVPSPSAAENNRDSSIADTPWKNNFLASLIPFLGAGMFPEINFTQLNMGKPTVCERELCVFAFQTLGVMNEAADEIATGAQRSALESPRKVVIFEPYPSVVDPNDPQMLAFNPRKKNYDRVMKALDSITSIREMTQAPYLEIKKQMDKQDPLAHPLLQWVISSNRSHIVKLPVNRQLKFMHTPHQFLLLSSPPAKESNFRAAKKLFGSTFAFHGSHIENWHSILRNGLVVASNTRLQLHGAMYGSGIYLSPMSSISFGYSGMNKKQKVSAKDEPASSSKSSNASQSQKKGQQSQFLQSRNLKCIALCEVITSPDLHKHGEIWVVPNTDHVCTRFFFVYEDGQVGDANINTQEGGIHKEILRVIGNQTATG
ncbi:Protein mono-ADP-ribosyltransferase PARP8 [Apodemus speciosus]|uniref:Poly [ADP-ribose] polymerase n=1 Tax=Apodemus speciosus TaxID=105296 RepID=A0ABQ0EZ42_APOSI